MCVLRNAYFITIVRYILNKVNGVSLRLSHTVLIRILVYVWNGILMYCIYAESHSMILRCLYKACSVPPQNAVKKTECHIKS